MVTFQFVPYEDIESMGSSRRISKLLNIVKQGKIVLLQGRLRKDEEADLIETTMEHIDERFHGIELSVIQPGKSKSDTWTKIRSFMINTILGDRQGLVPGDNGGVRDNLPGTVHRVVVHHLQTGVHRENDVVPAFF